MSLPYYRRDIHENNVPSKIQEDIYWRAFGSPVADNL
jgi:hypothetical protein